jgi:hypothetical protein
MYIHTLHVCVCVCIYIYISLNILDFILYDFPHFLFAEKFHTLALEGVPIFGLHNRTAAYRFVTLVDVFPSS